jgi:hypothetical protein
MKNALVAQIKTAKIVLQMLINVLTAKNHSFYMKTHAELLVQTIIMLIKIETVSNVKMDVNYAMEKIFAKDVLTDSIYTMTNV